MLSKAATLDVSVDLVILIHMPADQAVTSYSDLQRFNNCKRSWYLGSYLKLRPINEPMDGPLPFGTRVHSALELWGKGAIDTPADAYQALMAVDMEKAEKLGLFNDALVKEAKLGQVMLEGYVEWTEQTGFFAKYTVIDVESKLSDLLDVHLTKFPEEPPVQVLLRGKMDQRLRRNSDGAVLVHDYKTSGSLSPDTIGQFRQTPQLRLYLALQRQQAPAGEWAPGFVVTILRKVLRTKAAHPPFYEAVEVSVSTSNLDAAERNIRAQVVELVAVKTMLDSGKFRSESIVPYHVSWQCKTCPFRLPCTEWQDGKYLAAKQMLQELYVVGNPFERYDDGGDDATANPY